MGYAESCEDLKIWQHARSGFRDIYTEIKDFRDFSLRDQINRAALSVMNNIAEGFERDSRNEFAQFLSIAKASAGEVRSMLYALEDIRALDQEKAAQYREFYRRLSTSIAAFSRSIKQSL